MVANPLDHRCGSGVAHAESFTCLAAQQDLPGGGAVTDDVSGDDLVTGTEGGLHGRGDDHPATGQSLADVVVGVSDEPHRHAAWHEGTKALTSGTGEGEINGVVGKTCAIRRHRHPAAEHRADRAIDVADAELPSNRGAVGEGIGTHVDEFHVQARCQVVVLVADMVQRGALRQFHLVQDR